MPKLQDIIQNKNVLLKKKNQQNSILNGLENIVSNKKTIHFVEHLTPSKEDIKNLLDMDFDKTIKTIKLNKEKQLKKALEDFDIGDLLSKIDYKPNFSHDKKTKPLYKAADFLTLYDSLPDFSKNKINQKIYVGIISEVNENSIDVCIGKVGEDPLEYTIPYKLMPLCFRNKEFFRGDRVFVDVSKKEKNIIDEQDAQKDRKDKLKSFGIEVNGYKPVFYMTNGGKIIKGKIVGFGDDVNLNEIVFQPRNGQKFSISIEALKKGMDLANQQHKRKNGKFFVSERHISKKVA